MNNLNLNINNQFISNTLMEASVGAIVGGLITFGDDLAKTSPALTASILAISMIAKNIWDLIIDGIPGMGDSWTMRGTLGYNDDLGYAYFQHIFNPYLISCLTLGALSHFKIIDLRQNSLLSNLVGVYSVGQVIIRTLVLHGQGAFSRPSNRI